MKFYNCENMACYKEEGGWCCNDEKQCKRDKETYCENCTGTVEGRRIK